MNKKIFIAATAILGVTIATAAVVYFTKRAKKNANNVEVNDDNINDDEIVETDIDIESDENDLDVSIEVDNNDEEVYTFLDDDEEVSITTRHLKNQMPTEQDQSDESNANNKEPSTESNNDVDDFREV